MLKKLCLTFFDKEKYVIHYENLGLEKNLGLKLKKYIVLEFNQSQWLKPYVKFNIPKNRSKKKKKDDEDKKKRYTN